MILEHFFADETQFTLDGAVNSRNCCIWGSVLLYVVHEPSLHLDYITVLSGFTTNFILGPFFFFLRKTLLKVNRGVPSLVHIIAIPFNSMSFSLYMNYSA